MLNWVQRATDLAAAAATHRPHTLASRHLEGLALAHICVPDLDLTILRRQSVGPPSVREESDAIHYKDIITLPPDTMVVPLELG